MRPYRAPLRSYAGDTPRAFGHIGSHTGTVPILPAESGGATCEGGLMITAPVYDLFAVKKLLATRGYLNQRDKTHRVRGALWVITDRARDFDEDFFAYINAEFNTNFIYAKNGSWSTHRRPAWFWVPGHEPGMWLGPGVLED